MKKKIVVFVLASLSAGYVQAHDHRREVPMPTSGVISVIVTPPTPEEAAAYAREVKATERLTRLFIPRVDVSAVPRGDMNACLTFGGDNDRNNSQSYHFGEFAPVLSKEGLTLEGNLTYETCGGLMRYRPELKGQIWTSVPIAELNAAGFATVQDENGKWLLVDVEVMRSTQGDAAAKIKAARDAVSVNGALALAHQRNLEARRQADAADMIRRTEESLNRQ